MNVLLKWSFFCFVIASLSAEAYAGVYASKSGCQVLGPNGVHEYIERNQSELRSTLTVALPASFSAGSDFDYDSIDVDDWITIEAHVRAFYQKEIDRDTDHYQKYVDKYQAYLAAAKCFKSYRIKNPDYSPTPKPGTPDVPNTPSTPDDGNPNDPGSSDGKGDSDYRAPYIDGNCARPAQSGSGISDMYYKWINQCNKPIAVLWCEYIHPNTEECVKGIGWSVSGTIPVGEDSMFVLAKAGKPGARYIWYVCDMTDQSKSCLKPKSIKLK